VSLCVLIGGPLSLADISVPKAPDTKVQSVVQGGVAPSGSADNFLFTGSFLYNVPIEVPPGIAGMQPELSLQYNSSAQNSWVGVGWDLSLGCIQLSTKNGVPKYDSKSDPYIFILHGESQELKFVREDGNGNRLYQAKIEGAFQKFVKEGARWLVYDKSG